MPANGLLRRREARAGGHRAAGGAREGPDVPQRRAADPRAAPRDPLSGPLHGQGLRSVGL